MCSKHGREIPARPLKSYPCGQGTPRRMRPSRSEPLRTVERAKIRWPDHAGLNPSEIKQAAKVSHVTVYACLRKALAMGLEAGRKDAFHRPQEPRIDHADKAWVVHLACTKPKELGYAAELWTRSALAAHVRKHAAATAHPNLRLRHKFRRTQVARLCENRRKQSKQR